MSILQALAMEDSIDKANRVASDRIKILEKKNAQLESEIVKLNAQISILMKYEQNAVGKVIKCFPELTKSAIKIQAF